MGSIVHAGWQTRLCNCQSIGNRRKGFVEIYYLVLCYLILLLEGFLVERSQDTMQL